MRAFLNSSESGSQSGMPSNASATTSSCKPRTLRPVSPLPDWDGFATDPLIWATRLGFSGTVAAQPPPVATFSRGQEAHAVQAPSAPSWSSLPPNAPLAGVVQLLDSCMAHAVSRQSAATRRSIRSSRHATTHCSNSARNRPPCLTGRRPDSAADMPVGPLRNGRNYCNSRPKHGIMPQ